MNAHSFDVAREGYVNLLVGRQRPGHKGDTPEMLMARRRFFELNYYEPLRRRLEALVRERAPKTVAEIGCGEGYYIGGISERITGITCLATDIAKDGVRLAAKRYRQVRFAVADTNRLVPLADASVDLLLNIFAPRNTGEFARILQLGGRLMVVIPTARHLAELREVQQLLPVAEEKRRVVEESLAPTFVLETSEIVTAPLKLDGVAVDDLVAMTPNAWYLTPEQKQRLSGLDRRLVTAEFEILVFKPSRT